MYQLMLLKILLLSAVIKHFIVDIYSDFISAAAPRELSIDKATDDTRTQNLPDLHTDTIESIQQAAPTDSIESIDQAGNIKYSLFQGTNCELSTFSFLHNLGDRGWKLGRVIEYNTVKFRHCC